MNILKPLCYIISPQNDLVDGVTMRGIMSSNWYPVASPEFLGDLSLDSVQSSLLSLNILRRCDAVYLIDGWRDCELCRIEYDYSLRNNKLRFFNLDDISDGDDYISLQESEIRDKLSSRALSDLDIKFRGSSMSCLVEEALDEDEGMGISEKEEVFIEEFTENSGGFQVIPT